jgi:hypothetical protein
MTPEQTAKLKHDLRSAIRAMENAAKMLGQDKVDKEMKNALIGSLELAVKSLEANYRKLEGP